ncbi:hypothetical protein TNCV_4648921 [Trichonephila clavipes]|uniref:Uncharacterized protein n=1 Tax=Trichonephila clavipes TaxID=2585209 RepID=A0A8X6SXE6_TRICX|nr:hypothetical protein TNCV_4648921 [Trichonephila clavipes]
MQQQEFQVSLQTDHLIGTSAYAPQRPMITYTGMGGYQSPQVLPRRRHLSSDDANLYQDFILPRAPKPNVHSRDLSHAVLSYDIAAVDFLHHENPPTWAAVEPATLGAESQRQTNHATQTVHLRPCISMGFRVVSVPPPSTPLNFVGLSASLPYTAGLKWYWARTRDKASHDPKPIPLGYRSQLPRQREGFEQ